MLIQKYVNFFLCSKFDWKTFGKDGKRSKRKEKKIQAVSKCGRKDNNKRRMKLDGEK